MFQKNMEVLNNPNLRARLERMRIEDSSRHMSYCMTKSNDYLIMKNDVPFDDINNPRQAIKDMLSSSIKTPMAKNDIIITFGIGLCYLLDEVFNTYSSRIIVYEPDVDVLHFVLNNVDISEHLASGRVYITEKIDELIKKLSEIYLTQDKVEIVYLKNYALVKNSELLDLTQRVYDTCRSKMVDINTITRFSQQWLQNTLVNIGQVNSVSSKPTFKLSDLEGKFEGQTALILAAGPSLNENIESIKANRNKYVIFAVNKCIRVLESNGIIPDFVVCLDAMYTDSSLSGLEEFCQKTNCIMDIKSDVSLLHKNFKRFFISFSKNDAVINKIAGYNNITAYECGGTAAAFAFVAASKMGFSQIICSGLDLAFKGNVIYSTGEEINKTSDNQMVVANVPKNIVEVPSVTGEKVQTRDDYAAFINHFESLISDLGCKDVYNTSSFGALIQGMKNVQFENIPLNSNAMGTPIILAGVEPFKFNIEEWMKEELLQINNIIALISKNIFSPALVSSIVKSPMMYQYMQGDILRVLQSDMNINNADEFIAKSKYAIKDIIDRLQKNRLI